MPFKASTSVYVDVVCDACGRRYGFSRKVECQAGTEARAIIKLRQELAQLYRYKLHWNDKPPYYIDCPQCGFVPMWMVGSARKQKLESIWANTVFGIVLSVGCTGYALYKLTEKRILQENTAWEILLGVSVGVAIIGVALLFLFTKRVKDQNWPLENWLLENERPTTMTLPRLDAS